MIIRQIPWKCALLTWRRPASCRQAVGKKTVAAALTCEEKTTNEVATGQKMDAIHSSTQPRAVGPNTAPPQLHTYICPYCAKSVQSPVATGRVDHRRSKGCGKQFRVANGLLAGRTYSHACPTCGTVVHSTLASGQIRVTHRNPSGRQCRTNQWRVQTWWSFQLKVATQHGNAPHYCLNLQEK